MLEKVPFPLNLHRAVTGSNDRPFVFPFLATPIIVLFTIFQLYAFVVFESASKKWVMRLLIKAIIVDKNGVIIDGFANFASSNFSKELR